MLKTVSPEFYEKVLDRFPALMHRTDYRRLFTYLAFDVPRKPFHTFDSRIQEDLLLSYEFVATLAGRTAAAKSKNFRAYKFLDSFKADVLPEFKYTDYVPNVAVRAVLNKGIDDDLQSLITKEVQKSKKERTLFFHSGKTNNKRNQTAEVSYEESAIQDFIEEKEVNEDQLSIQKLLPKTFNLLSKNITANLDQAIEYTKKHTSGDTLINQLKIIAAIQEDPSVHYKPGVHSYRLFPIGTNMLSLKREVRKIFCNGWTDIDLQASQLAIFSAWRECPLMYSVFQKGLNPWEEIAKSLGKLFDCETKGAIKKVIYPILFGTKEEKLKESFEILGIEESNRNPFFQELFRERKILFDEIRKVGHIVDFYGRKHKIDDIYIPGKGLDKKNSIWAGSLAAIQIQAIELHIMTGISDAVRYSPSADVMLFQHDGMTIAFKDEARKPSILKRMQRNVADKAASAGTKAFGKSIILKLEHENLGDA